MSRTLSGKSTEGSDRDGRLPPALTRGDFAAASVMAAVSYLTAKFTAPTGPGHAAVFFAASVMLIAAGRLADRLWDSTMAPALRFSAPQLCILSRFPFRLLGGGIAFTVVLLAAKRADIVPVRDVPAIEIFATGVVLSAGYYAFAEGWKYLRGYLRPGTGDTPERNDR